MCVWLWRFAGKLGAGIEGRFQCSGDLLDGNVVKVVLVLGAAGLQRRDKKVLAGDASEGGFGSCHGRFLSRLVVKMVSCRLPDAGKRCCG